MHNSEGVVGVYIVDENEGVIETAIMIYHVKGWSARVIRIYSPDIFQMVNIERAIKTLQYSILCTSKPNTDAVIIWLCSIKYAWIITSMSMSLGGDSCAPLPDQACKNLAPSFICQRPKLNHLAAI